MNERKYIISNPGQTFTLLFGRDRKEKYSDYWGFGLMVLRTKGASEYRAVPHCDSHKLLDLKLKAFKLTKLRNLGNHKHNSDVIRQGKGELIVGYRPNKPAIPHDYGPCENCFVYLVQTDLWKHRCPAINSEDASSGIAKGKRKRLAHTCKSLIPTPAGMSANDSSSQ